jgi:hypothetical protein
MKATITCITLVCAATLSLFSCSTEHDFTEEDEPAQETEVIPEMPEDSGETEDEPLNPNTQPADYPNALHILFTTEGATVTNPFEGQGVTVTADKGHIIIRSTREDLELHYILSGITPDGSVKIYGNYKFCLVLNGVGITNPRGAAINIQCGKKVTVTLAGETNNRLTDAATYNHTEGEDMKATFFSEGQLNIYGKGRLEIRGKYKHAICTDDYFCMYEGDICINEAASDGIHANDEVLLVSGALAIRSSGDGIESEKDVIQIQGGQVRIFTTGEKAHGLKSKGDLTIDTAESIEINTYGNASKGCNISGNLTIKQGEIIINTAGDALYESEEADISSAAGIKCDGDILIDNTTLTILSTGRGGKGISADGGIIVNDGQITLTTTGGQYVYDRNNDTAAKAMKCEGDMRINGGSLLIKTYGVEAEGLESKATLTLAGGRIEILAYDDCINAANHIQIDGGEIYCNSTVNDGIDSNGTVTITGGTIVSAGSSQPEEGIDCDQNRFTITGGTIIGLGGATSTPTASACTQHALVYGSSTTAVELIHIESATNKEVLSLQLPKTYSQRITLLFSSPSLAANTSYTIYTGGKLSGGTDFHGLRTGATYTGGTQVGTFTTNTMVSSLGNSGMGGGGRW